MQGNIEVRRPVEQIFKRAGNDLLIADNVFPAVDVLNVEPLRRVIQDVFSRTIIRAPGMEKIEDMSSHGILPTPGAVLRGAEIFADALGDCMVLDVGGATTDVHSVTDGSPEFNSMQVEPQPRAKRTVEGDLGVFVNAENTAELLNDSSIESIMGCLAAIPSTEDELKLTEKLCSAAVRIAVERHAGTLADMYTAAGRRRVVRGRDLTAVKWIIATGGALTRISGASEGLGYLCRGAGKYLLPSGEAEILIDRDYLFSALGTIAQAYPDDVKISLKRWAERERKREAG